MSTIYLSGPISLGGRLTADETLAFVEAFREESERLRSKGHTIINPCECPKEDSWEAYMRHGIRAVTNCDIVGTLPRWIESRGSVLEVFVATQLGIPVVPSETL